MLKFKQFLAEGAIQNWLLDRRPRKIQSDILPPPSISEEELLKKLQSAELTQNSCLIKQAKRQSMTMDFC